MCAQQTTLTVPLQHFPGVQLRVRVRACFLECNHCGRNTAFVWRSCQLTSPVVLTTLFVSVTWNGRESRCSRGACSIWSGAAWTRPVNIAHPVSTRNQSKDTPDTEAKFAQPKTNAAQKIPHMSIRLSVTNIARLTFL